MRESKKKSPLYTQKTLLIKLRDQHDEASWHRFIDYYKNYIYVVIKGLGVGHSELDDVSQAILVKLWKNLPEFDYEPEKGTFR